jgi:hypothetical protein
VFHDLPLDVRGSKIPIDGNVSIVPWGDHIQTNGGGYTVDNMHVHSWNSVRGIIWEIYESTKRSLFNHFGFLGLNLKNLLKRTWDTGAIPIGAPG